MIVALTVVILAAGQGKRMNSDLPKVLQPLAGRPLLAHVIATARELGPDAINIVYGHGGEAVREVFADADLNWSHQSEQLGTGHALAQALPFIPDDHRILVLYGDVPLVRAESLKPLLVHGSGDEVVLLTAYVDEPQGYGRILRNEQREVSGVIEEQDASVTELAISEVNTGLMRLPSGPLRGWLDNLSNSNVANEYYLTDAVVKASGDGYEVTGLPVADPSEGLGINNRNQLAVAERLLQRRYADTLMEQGATLVDPSRFDLRGKLTVGRDVFIDAGVVFEGEVELGDRVHIGPNTVISNSKLGDDCLIHPNSVLAGVIAGSQCEIGPFARLRPGTEFSERVKVGNFVEVKASSVAADSKMNHLTYVGDSSIGGSVNVGARTIVCNYDGAVKSRTVVGDGAFIGSGVMLVAPVEVGSGATIGAGSTVTKDAPAQKLTVARARQTVVKGWKRPRKSKK